ncbi:trigger factor [Rhodovibrionaceae bacterium A322]
MQVTETLSEGLKREFNVVISAADLDEKINARLDEVGKTVKIPGFRPGKVPAGLLKQRFGQSVLGEVLEGSVNSSSQQVLNERGLKPALQPKIEITSFEEGKDLEYSIAIEVLPTVEPMDFSAIELERLKVEVSDAEVDEALERLASQQKSTKPLKRARKSRSGDVVVIDFAGTVDGTAHPGMDAEDHHLELGSNSFIPGFEEQLEGLKKGEEKDVVVTFPADYGNATLAGQEAVFKVTVKDVLEAVPAEIDDELAKSFGTEGLDDLKSKLREQLGQEYEGLTRNKLKRELLDILAEGHSYEVPEGMVELEFDAIWQQVEADRKAGNLEGEDADKDEDTLKAEFQEIAVRRVRLGLLLSHVGEANKIEVNQDELNQALFREVQKYPGQEQQIFEAYQKNPQALANLRGPIFEEKVVDFIVEQAKVTDRGVTADELQAEMEAAEAAETAAEEKPKKKAAAKKPAAKKAPAKKAAPKKAAKKDADAD